MDLIEDLPIGPLDNYRHKASFNWKSMKLFFVKPEILKLQKEAFEFLEKHPLFQHPDKETSLEEERSLTLKRMNVIYGSKIFYPDDYFFDRLKNHAITGILGSYDFSLTARKGLLKDFCVSAIYGLGSERHRKYISALLDNKMGCAFCLTEIAHGTNTKGMQTEAHFDVKSQSFILRTPSFEAAKCWAGCLGKTASHGVVFAQLYTPDGVCHGLHCFIVPLRNPITLIPYTGVTIIDMGPKLGLNGIDNGVLIFNNYYVSKENLLNKTGDITAEGQYVSPFSDPNKRFGASLGNLSVGRVTITSFGVIHLSKALTIAIRYSGIRRQFGHDGQNELPVLEYPLQQWRLFPYLGGMYMLQVFSEKLVVHFNDFNMLMASEDNPDILAMFGQEIHALSSVSKPYSGWLARDGIQECREACGGHGYLKSAGFGQLRNDNDANLTYEGDNNVLLQQTSNWLLTVWSKRHFHSCKYPMRTVDFIKKGDQILTLTLPANAFENDISDNEIIELSVVCLDWLVCWLCEITTADFKDVQKKHKNSFSAKNHTQIYRAHTLSLVYFEKVLLEWFNECIKDAEQSIQAPLKKLCALFILTRLLKHIAVFFEGGLLQNGSLVISNIYLHIRRLLEELLPDAVALIDVFAPPDFVLQSVLGNADGKVYEHMYQKMITAPDALTRDEEWQLISYTSDKIKAKM